jgi:hypothetical protein
MRRFVSLACFFAFATTLNASDIGVSVNGTCKAGSRPGTPVPIGSTQNLPFDFTFTLSDGDRYLIDGAFTVINTNGVDLSNIYRFQVTYEGNGSGGSSAADTITVDLAVHDPLGV